MKTFKVVPKDKWCKCKISKSIASFANMELHFRDKELYSNILKKNMLKKN